MTLVEVLIVLVIIGIAASAVSLSVGAATRAPSVESEARRFALRLQAAADDAMLGDRMVALTADKGGYGFAKVDADGAIPGGRPEIDPHRLPGGITMTLSAAPPLVLGLDGAAKPLVATVTSGRQRWIVRYDGLTAVAMPAAPS
ncbi:prepilin-type N-terminal cleavage/methylation domain-containing protein [Sphingomonas sp. DT-204]|uniref:prepilin-type N-terminal cleavage/methylation domain-containing protein n=1 Tax=Sphingomonas sp. DT-204 TaxID=3396166 RepID=UPI003F1C35F8